MTWVCENGSHHFGQRLEVILLFVCVFKSQKSSLRGSLNDAVAHLWLQPSHSNW